MQLARLRHQILLAMGLPACWTATSPDRAAPPAPPADRNREVTLVARDPDRGPEDGWQPNPAARLKQACTPETACGRSDSQHGPTGCGPHGDSLESFAGNYQKMSVTRLSWGANPGELRTFTLDPAETAHYQSIVTVTSGRDHYCCYSQCTPARHPAQLPVTPPGMQMVTNCIAAPSQVTTPHANNQDCPAAQGSSPYVFGTNSQCCYGSFQPIPPPQEERHYRGRAARVDGDAIVAPVREGRTWSVGVVRPAVDGMAASTRAALRDAWQVAAQMEHASIAAFAALSLRLIALGAPAALIARTHEAALDEIRHAQLAFALAAAYADSPLEPARFADIARLPTTSTLAALARETFLDGCIEETAAAVDASLAASAAQDPAVTETLRSIADDEARHAELAWAIVAWCVRAEPAIAIELRALLTEQLAATPQPVATPGALSRHGIRSSAESARTRADVLREIVAPCLAALA
jgi:hypothetical protein